MSVFSTKTRGGQKVTVVAANIEQVTNGEDGKALIYFTSGSVLPTGVGYDSVRRNVAKALAGAAEADAE